MLHFLLICKLRTKIPLPVTGRGISLFLKFFQIEILYPTGIVFSVCSAISPKNEEGGQSRGTWNTAAQFVKRGYAAKTPLLAVSFAFILCAGTTEAPPPLDKFPEVW